MLPNTKLVINDAEVYPFTDGPLLTNSYLINVRPHAFLIDTPWRTKNLLETIEINNLNLTCIILTHAHFDHIKNAKYLSEYFKIPVFLSCDDKRILKKQHLLHSLHDGGEKLELPGKPWLRFIDFDDNIKLISELNTFDLYRFPGHTPGSILISYKEKIIFSGDSIYLDNVPNSLLPETNEAVLRENIKDFHKMFKGNIMLMPGHGRYGAYNRDD